jgi:diaminopimelate epimerase
MGLMNDSATMPFRKMNGLGNDFVILDARARPIKMTTEIARRIADRSQGVGCDQVIVLEPSEKADTFMRIYNSDGSEVGACGNAARCVALLLAQETGRAEVTIETQEAVLRAEAASADRVTIDNGEPRLAWDEIPLSEPFHDTTSIELRIGPIDAPVLHSPSVVNVGNPHAIFWVDDIQGHDLARLGPLLENHPLFPQRANISLAQITSRSGLKLRTWERGAGLTKACGTAACAAAVSAVRKRFTDRKVTVELPGGPLAIEWTNDNHVLMTGPAELEFEGRLEADTLSRAQA